MSRLTRLVKLKRLVVHKVEDRVAEPEPTVVLRPKENKTTGESSAKKAARDRFTEIFGKSFQFIGFNPVSIPESALLRCWWNAARRCGGNVDLTMAMLQDLAKIDDGCASMRDYMDAQGRWRRYKLWLRGSIICAGPKYQEFNDG
jgi:hypothetical protein